MPLEASVLRDTAALEALRPEWHALWLSVPGASPFRSPDWLLPWWRHIGEGALLTIVLRDAGRLVGVVPLYVFTQPRDGSRVLFPLGVATTDLLDALLLPADATRAMEATFAALAATHDDWDVAEWPQLLADAALLTARAPDGWGDCVAPADPCHALLLQDPPDASAVPKAMRRDLRNYRGRAERAGKVRFELAEPATLDALFDAHVRLHGARWEGRGEAGVLASPQVLAAHRDALPGLLRDDVLRLHALRLDGAVVGTLYGFIDRPGGPMRRFNAYLGGFDPAWSRISPGTLLIAEAMARAAADGAVLFDFLRGDEAYKSLWGAHDVPTWRRQLRPPA